jgi:hypothetical protein
MITQIKIYFLKDQQFPVTSNFEDMTNKSENSTLIFRSVPVVSWRSVGCGVIFRCLSGVVTNGGVILRSFGVVAQSSVSSGNTRLPWIRT